MKRITIPLLLAASAFAQSGVIEIYPGPSTVEISTTRQLSKYVSVSPSTLVWTVNGIVAYSKLCTHVGCPVGLYQAAEGLLLCPCQTPQPDDQGTLLDRCLRPRARRAEGGEGAGHRGGALRHGEGKLGTTTRGAPGPWPGRPVLPATAPWSLPRRPYCRPSRRRPGP